MREPKTARKLDRRYQRAKKEWTPGELEVLSNKYGLISDRALSKLLQRSPNANKIAATRKLHINRKMNFFSATEASKALGIGCPKTVLNWASAGWLRVRRSTVKAGNTKAWLFKLQHIVQLIRERPWLFDPKNMPETYFRNIVLEEYQRDPWYTSEEAAPLLGLRDKNAVHRYIYRNWLPAIKKPGGPWQGVWIIRRSAVEYFLANDPRPERAREMHSNARKRTIRKHGNPLRLSVVWSVLCPDCGQTVVVRADPALTGPQVQQAFIQIYTNGKCSHGMVCSLGKTVV